MYDIARYKRSENMTSKERLLNMKQAAEILGISQRTLYQWSWRNQNLPFVKVGGALRVSEKDLNEYIEKRKRSPEED